MASVPPNQLRRSNFSRLEESHGEVPARASLRITRLRKARNKKTKAVQVGMIARAVPIEGSDVKTNAQGIW